MELRLWKLVRSVSPGIRIELHMRGWKMEEVMKDLAHFQFVSLTTCERTQTGQRLQEKLKMAAVQGVWQSPGQGGEDCGELASWTGRW